MTSQVTGQRDSIIEAAARRKGIPYRIDPPPDGITTMDCSLFVVLTLQEVDIPLPAAVRTAEQIRQACDPIDWDSVLKGDLVFFEGTYNAAGPAGPDGHIASHVGISLGKGTHRMWDCHASGESGPPGVGETDISTDYWQPKLFQAGRPKGLGSDASPSAETTHAGYELTDDGVRMRAQPSTSAEILVQDVGRGTTVTAVSDQVVDADGHSWRNVRTPGGQTGWIAAEFLESAADRASGAAPSPAKYQVSDDGVRMRAQPSTSAEILVQDVGRGTTVTAVSDQVVDADGHSWRNVRTPGGQTGWIAAEFLESATDRASGAAPRPAKYQVSDDGVRMRAQPSTSAEILVQDVGRGTTVTAVSDQVVDADGHSWRNVRTPGGQTGWVAAEFLQPPGSTDTGELTSEADHFFGFAVLWPHIQVAGGKYGADAKIIAGIIYQESGFKNVRVHDDGTGHGLLGLDDNGLLPDFEKWSGVQCGRGQTAISIPPKPQIEYCATTIAAYTGTYGSAINAARVWHRGPGLWRDDRGQNYENLVNAHIQELFGGA